jgi:hypothetical protein
MGAIFVSRSYDGKLTTAELQKKFKEDQDEARHESGHSYSGTISELAGLKFTNMVFDDPNTAVKYLEQRAEKYGPGLVVRSKIADLKASKRFSNANEKCREFERKIWDFRRVNPKSKRNDTYQQKMSAMWQDLHQMEKELHEKSKMYCWLVGGLASS